MSLDFILVKGHSLPASLAELEPDEAFGAEQYRTIAESLFGNVYWESDGTGFVQQDDVSIELHPSDASLSLGCRGSGDIISLINRIAVSAHSMGLVIIDAQSSELIAPEAPLGNPTYVEWYHTVIANAKV